LTIATVVGKIATNMSKAKIDAKQWIDGGLDKINSRAKNLNQSAEEFRISLDHLEQNSSRALNNAIMVARGFGLNDVAVSLERLAGMLPDAGFAPDLHVKDGSVKDLDREDDIIDAEFEVQPSKNGENE
tara:strand:- start:703 stop:1089 length:387 start_codon:yes stop_codon:yes gene_type:complete